MIVGGRVGMVFFRPVSRPQVFNSYFVTRITLRRGGLDMPFAKIAQGYSTTEYE